MFTQEHWAIGVVKAPIQSFLNPSFIPTVTWITGDGPYEFLADCFGLIADDRHIIMAERFDYRKTSSITPGPAPKTRIGKGSITALTVNADAKVTDRCVAFHSDDHISYPFTIYDGGVWYCLPEEVAKGALNLYRRQDDGQWQHVKSLLPHAVVDPTICKHGGFWWMFGTSVERPLDELRIWYADALLGDWRPHPCNPVRVNRRNTRPGGTPFYADEILYRPTQNCNTTYGGSIVINRIEDLTTNTFSESAFLEIFPASLSPYVDGAHTLSQFGDWTLLDAKRHSLSPRIGFRRLLSAVTTARQRRRTG
jgi:hypothetical protein